MSLLTDWVAIYDILYFFSDINLIFFFKTGGLLWKAFFLPKYNTCNYLHNAKACIHLWQFLCNVGHSSPLSGPQTVCLWNKYKPYGSCVDGSGQPPPPFFFPSLFYYPGHGCLEDWALGFLSQCTVCQRHSLNQCKHDQLWNTFRPSWADSYMMPHVTLPLIFLLWRGGWGESIFTWR